MKRLLTLLLGTVGVMAIACGGNVSGQMADCPTDGASCSQGTQCKTQTFNACAGQTLQQRCTCENGAWSCIWDEPFDCVPDSGPMPPPIRETCGFAGAVTDGSMCYPDEKGRSCKRFADGCILDETCTCDGSKFTCTGGPSPSCDGGTPDGGADAASDSPTGG